MFNKCISINRAACSAALLCSLLLSACEDAKPVKGFYLPEGDVNLGKQVFIDNGCGQCHTVKDISLPERGPDPQITIDLGGKVYRVKDYGELLDAVVNPNHIISPKYLVTLEKDQRRNATSPMPNFNDEITVAELINLVTFLHAQYSKMDPQAYRLQGH